jgi:DNA-binding NarL/FixJ family response regulator
MHKIAIVDDHKILRDGLKVLLLEMPDIEVVIEASNGQEFIGQLKYVTPELVIIDINMPIMAGDEAIRKAKEMLPELKVIVLSMNSDGQYFQVMSDLGVDGFIVKESDYEELTRAINTVLKGGKYFSQELLLNLVNKRATSSKINLTDREIEILRYLCLGLSASEIAEKLFLSVRTVEKHRSEMLQRSGMPNSISLVVYAIKNGIIKL